MLPADRDRHDIALVVDDDPDSLGMVASVLEENGITVIVARSGATAIDLARRIEPDVVLMDAVMPEMDGFETCLRMKSGADPIPAPVVFMTGLTEPEHIVRGLNSGGVDYVTKPVVVDELLARITIHMINAKMIQSAREALDTTGRTVIAVNSSGELIWSSPKAQEELARGGIPCARELFSGQAFGQWLRACISAPTSSATPYRAGECEISYLGSSPSREILLRVRAAAELAPEEMLAEVFQLTPREAEVLYWLSMGKSNRDIAQILSLSARTINKHLEQVFQKMGVENRTSAAVLADRLLHGEAQLSGAVLQSKTGV